MEAERIKGAVGKTDADDVVEDKVRGRLWKDTGTMSWLELQLPSVEEGSATPFAVADQLLRQSGELVRGEEDK